MRRSWTPGYLYVADETGAEIPGSRRDTARCATIEDYQRLWRELEAQAGEDCLVRHSEDKGTDWQALRRRATNLAMWTAGLGYFAAVLLNPPAWPV